MIQRPRHDNSVGTLTEKAYRALGEREPLPRHGRGNADALSLGAWRGGAVYFDGDDRPLAIRNVLGSAP